MVYIKLGKHLSTLSVRELGIDEEGDRLQGTGDSYSVTSNLFPSSFS